MRRRGLQCRSLTSGEGDCFGAKADVGADENADNTFEDRRDDTPTGENSDDEENGDDDSDVGGKDRTPLS